MKTSKYLELREYLDTVPVIETHEHYTSNTERYSDCFPLLLGYVKSDLHIAAGLGGERVIEYLADPKIPFRKRWECFEGLYAKCRHTAYARGMERGLTLCWGIKEISYSSLCELNERLEERDNDFFCRTMERFHIKIHVADIFESRFFAIMEGTDRDYTEISRFAFPLPAFHRLYQYESIRYVEELTGKVLPTLEDYAAAVEELIEKAHAWGAVCIKDQSAYFRPIDYGQPTFHQAESVYNRLVSHPGETVGFREGRDLDDWLFSRFLRKAGELDMPVQIHTGLPDRVGLYEDRVGSDIRAANAALLIPTMERYRNVRFDLFHTNWPYMDEALYLGKNTPNAWIDMCWTHSIDPLYAVAFLKRAVMTIPSSRILGFGGDSFVMENDIGYLDLAKDNTAEALAELADDGWLSLADAKELAADFFYRNPKDFFRIP